MDLETTQDVTNVIGKLREGGFIQPQDTPEPTDVTPEIDATQVGTDGFQFPTPDASSDDIMQSIQSLVATPAMPDDSGIANIEDAIMGSTSQLEGRAADTARAEEEVGLPGLESQRRDIASQLSQVQASLSQGLVNEEGRVVPMGVITGRQAHMKRQAAAQAQGLLALDQTLKGNIETAQAAVERAVGLKYDPIEARLNTLSTALELNTNRFNRKEKALAEKRQGQIELAKMQLENQRAEDAAIQQFAVSAVGDGRISAATGSKIMQDIAKGDYSSLSLIPTPISDSGILQKALQEAEVQSQEVDKALAIQRMIDELEGHTALGAATGPLGSRLPSLKTLTGETVDFAATHEQLINSLTLENLDLMSGVLSETDIKILSGAATRLRRDMSKEDYVEELGNMKKTFQRTINQYGTTPEQEKFYYDVDDTDLQELNEFYPQATTPSEFSASEYFN